MAVEISKSGHLEKHIVIVKEGIFKIDLFCPYPSFFSSPFLRELSTFAALSKAGNRSTFGRSLVCSILGSDPLALPWPVWCLEQRGRETDCPHLSIRSLTLSVSFLCRFSLSPSSSALLWRCQSGAFVVLHELVWELVWALRDGRKDRLNRHTYRKAGWRHTVVVLLLFL